jgi:hypothetical protein
MRSRLSLTCLFVLGFLGLVTAESSAWARGKSITGDLVIESSTRGAQVFVDDEEIGTIPLGRPIKLKPGQHTVKVVKPGFTRFLESVTIKVGKSVRLEVDLFPVSGVLHFQTSEPGARIYLDGKFVGQTPLTGHELKAGIYKVRIAKLGFYDVFRTVTVTAGQEQRVEATLIALPAAINPLVEKKSPKKWYEKWWVWTTASVGLAVIAMAIGIPLGMQSKDPIKQFNPDRTFNIP